MYIAKYLPVEREWTDGCTIMDSEGRISQWDPYNYTGLGDVFKARHRVAELFIVTYEFNQMVVIGRPCAAALKWVKEGMEFKHFDVKETTARDGNGVPITNVACGLCGHVHEHK